MDAAVEESTIRAASTDAVCAPVEAAPVETVYRPRHPLSLRLTLAPLARGRHNPLVAWDGDAVWLTMRSPLGAATLHLRPRGAEIAAAAWGDGADWAIAGVPELLGDGDDPDALDVSGNEFLTAALRHTRGMRMLRTNLVMESLVAAIIEQKVTSVEAWRAWRQLVTRHGESAPGPAPERMRVFPRPDVWAMIPSWQWHRAGVDPQRSRTVLAAASVASGLERTLGLGRGGPEVLAKLRSVRGVGPWTAAETSQRAHGDVDSVSVGDYHLPATVGWALIGAPVDDDGMLELLEPWAGQRQRVMRLIEASGFRPPRFGPRITIQDHRGH